MHFQKDLYTTLKADSETEKLTVMGIALGITYDPGGGKPNPFQKGELTDYVDWGNFHPYPGGGNPFSFPAPYAGLKKYYWHGSFPSINLDEYPYAFNTYHPPYAPKPMASTETGYSTYSGGASERTHAKYIPRLYAEYFRLGIKRAYVYEFIDEFKDPNKTNREANFGSLRRDTSAKPGYTALKSLIALLRNYPNPFNSSTLISYELSRSSHVRLEIYDAPGRLVTTLVDDFQNAGHYKVPFSNSRLPSGTYHYKLTGGDLITHRKMLLLR